MKKKTTMKMPATSQPVPMAGQAKALASPLQARDDLVNIEGIDPATEMALNSIGIRRFSDFHGHTPETLAQALQARTGLFITAETIAKHDWMGWAEIYQAENSSGHSQENAVGLSIQNVQFQQVETPATEPSAKRLLGKIRCSLNGAQAAARMADQKTLCVQIHADDEATGGSSLLAAQSQRLQADQIDYRAELEFKVPGPGRYRLFVIAFLLQANSPISFYPGPTLRVIP